MSRRSRSPKRRLQGEDDSRPSSGSGYRSRAKSNDRDWVRTQEGPYREFGAPERKRNRDYGGSRRENQSARDHSGYEERDREREREKGRERYERGDAEGENNSSRRHRRSASPRSRRRDGHSHSASPKSLVDKTQPNFAPSGLLAAETNTVNATDGTSTVLKYNEPPEARKPILGWRLYVFKDSEQVELLHIHRQSAYLVGRDRLVADIALDHPSCSKQHAAFQYRYVQDKDEYGSSKGAVKPFVIDLESTNGTMVNDETIPAARYYELKAGDVIKFGLSTREYVLLHDEAY